MTCFDRESAAAYLSGDLEPAMAQQCAAHLLTCDDCRTLVDQLSREIDEVRTSLHVLDERPTSVPGVETITSRPVAPRSAVLSWQWAAATLSAVLVVVVAMLLLWQEPASATELLARAETADITFAAVPDRIVHRSIDVERRSATGVVRRRVEIWHDAARGLKVRRAYDSLGMLVGSEREQRGVAGTPTPELSVADMWRWEPSSTGFRRIGDVTAATVRETAETFELSYRPTPDMRSMVIAATLIISKQDAHALHQAVSVRQDDEVVDYTFSETRRQQLAKASVEPAVFEITAVTPAPSNPKPATPVAARFESPVVSPAPNEPPIAIDRIELSAWYGIHRLESCLATASIGRTGGRVALHAGVISDACKLEALRTLATLSPAADVSIVVVDQPAHDTVVPQHDAVAFREVHNYFARMMPATAPATGPNSLDAVAAQFVGWIVEHVHKTSAQSKALTEFLAVWPLDRARHLDNDALAAWQNVVRDHVRSVRQEAALLHAQLQPIFFPGAPAISGAPGATRTLADIVHLSERLSVVVDELTLRLQHLFDNDATALSPPGGMGRGLEPLFVRLEELAAAFDGPWMIGPQ